jgi:hypothetical protein
MNLAGAVKWLLPAGENFNKLGPVDLLNWEFGFSFLRIGLIINIK